jgi:hypothetical protein
MASFDFQYVLAFTNSYDENVILNSDLPDKNDSAFRNLVQIEVSKILNILQLHRGVKELNTLLEYNSNKYKIGMNLQ